MALSKHFLLPIILCFLYSLSAQDAPGINWKEIETDHYRIIFPIELSSDANRTANILEGMYSNTGRHMGGRHRKIPIIMRNQSAIPNAYVSLGPWISEWNHIRLPLKEMGSLEWYSLLSIHEGRHFFQFGHLNRGVNKIFGLLGGEYIQSIANFTMVPGWVWEGDAVLTETLLSESGRGRQPFFNREIRALLLDDYSTTYRQALYGSFLDEYPNYYHYGYLISSHIRRTYGDKAMEDILDQTMRWPFIRNPFLPLSAAAKKITGRTATLLFYDTMVEMTSHWKLQIKDHSFTSITPLSPQKSDNRIDYLFPGFDVEGRLYAVRRGLGEITALVRFETDSKIKVITQLPEMVENFGLHIDGGYAVWSEIQPDRRWTKRNWANVVLLSLEDGQRRQITQLKRYYYPSISHDGTRIATVEFNEARECYLVILDSDNGDILKKFPSKSIMMHPRWSKDGSEIVYISQHLASRDISIINISTGVVTVVKPKSKEEIFRPLFYNNFIIYESPISGIDNLYAINRLTRRIFQVISSKIAATNAAIATGASKITINDYTRNGERIVSAELDTSSWHPLENVQLSPDPIIAELTSTAVPISKLMTDVKYTAVDYNHINDLLNFHSWVIIPDTSQPSISFRSDNVLGTTSLQAKTTYNRNEKSFFQELRVSYKGLYPVLSGGFGWGQRSLPDTLNVKVGRGQTAESYIISTWQEKNFNGKIILPLLNRRTGPKNEAFIVSTTIQKTVMSDRKISFTWPNRDDLLDTTLPNKSANGTIFPITMQMNYNSETESAPRDVMTRKGGEVDFVYTATPFKSNFKGNRTYFSGTLFSKGIFPHDSFRLSAGIEKKKDDGYAFKSLVEMPLGHSYFFHEKVRSFKGAYRVPVLYPEAGFDILPFLKGFRFGYIKRLSLDVIAHWLRGSSEADHTDYLTLGLGATFDMAGFDLPLVLPITLIYAYNPLNNSGSLELNIDF